MGSLSRLWLHSRTLCDAAAPYPDQMDDLIRSFAEPVGAWAGRGMDDGKPPDLQDDYAARMTALLVEALGGTITISRSELRAIPEQFLLLVRQDEEVLQLETRRLATGSPTL